MKNAYEIRGDVTVIFMNSPKYGKFETIIDTLDLPKAQQLRGTWSAIRDKRSGNFYVKAQDRYIYGMLRHIDLHRFLTDAPDGMHVDHINNKTLDNRRSVNLRVCTPAENQQNLQGANRNSKSGIRGVHWHKQAKRWIARLKVNGKLIHVGQFRNIEDAEKAVKTARKKHMPFSKEGRGA